MTKQEIVDLLEKGRQSDIWYDANLYGDTEYVELIEQVQIAMFEAAEYFKKPKEEAP